MMVAITSNLLHLPISSAPKLRCHTRFSYSASSWVDFGSRDSRCARLIGFQPLRVGITARNEGAYDPELRSVLELATDEELFELENILYGPSYFSPLLKSITSRPDVDYLHGEDDIEGREDFISHLEARFLFLAADARSTISKLSTEDLEVEIFLYLLQEYSSQGNSPTSFPWNDIGFSDDTGSLEAGLSRWKVHALASFRAGTKELKHIILKASGMATVAKIYQLLAKKLSGKMLLEAAEYEIKHEIIKMGGQLAAINLESRAALLTARQSLTHAASRYLGLRSVMMLVGPVLWGTFLADIVIQNLGTDYARILRAIYAFAQIRLTRTYGWTSSKK